jgi:hypothetical protein
MRARLATILSATKPTEHAMTHAHTDFWQDQADEPEIRIEDRLDPDAHEAYWRNVYWSESEIRHDREFEDYAPAYCVGYVGFAQYGDSFTDAEKSLIANWLRIKSGSRLDLNEATLAIRAAWDHAACLPSRQPPIAAPSFLRRQERRGKRLVSQA